MINTFNCCNLVQSNFSWHNVRGIGSHLVMKSGAETGGLYVVAQTGLVLIGCVKYVASFGCVLSNP